MPRREHSRAGPPKAEQQQTEPVGRRQAFGLAAGPASQLAPGLSAISARLPAGAALHQVNRRLPVALRQSLAMHLGHVQGNRRLLTLLLPRPSMALQRPVQLFGGEEHRSLASEATGGETLDIDLGDGTKLTFGELSALADWFGTVAEIRSLASTPAGQAELRWARWAALHIGAEPAVSDAVKANVRNRYYKLAASNYAHFSAGGTAQSEYAGLHEEALGLAFFAGASENPVRWNEARVSEAFAQHFLADMFAAGHIRTPRMEIERWYEENYPDSVERFVNYAAWRITDYLDAAGDIPWYWPNSSVAGKIKAKILALGGPAVQSYSLGDLVGMAYHNQDNVGLGVVSDVGPDGVEVPGGFQWLAKGDDRLAESPITRQMTLAAMRASLADLDAMREAGRAAAGGACVPDEQLQPQMWAALANLHRQPYAAERFIPREDPQAGNASMNWRWGEIDPMLRGAIDSVVRRTIAGELRGKAGAVDEVLSLTRTGTPDPHGAVRLRVRAAFVAFCDELAAKGIAALEEAMEARADVPPESALDAGVPLPAGVAEEAADAGVP